MQLRKKEQHQRAEIIFMLVKKIFRNSWSSKLMIVF